jgi:hypothetical protein
MDNLHTDNQEFTDISQDSINALLPVNQSFGDQQVWHHLTECHSPVDYKGNPFDEAVGLMVLAAAQLVKLNLLAGRNLSGPLELDPSRHQTLPQGSGMSLL